MDYIFFDTETTSTDQVFGQLLEVSLVKCDENLDVVDGPLNLECRLSPGIIPQPQALVVTNKTIEEINSRPLTHYQMVRELMGISRKWGSAIWMGWNSSEFDFEWMQSVLYKTLDNTFFHQAGGNRRSDALSIARAVHTFAPGTIEVPLGARGKKTFKLEKIASANGVNHEQAHSAGSDAMAALGVAKMIKERCQTLWDHALSTTSKEAVHDLVTSEKVFVTCESYYGNIKGCVQTFLLYHPLYGSPMCLDLRVDPATYLNSKGEELREKLRTSPKVLRTLRSNHHPIVLGSDYIQGLKDYAQLGLEELRRRAELVGHNEDFKKRVYELLALEAQAKIQGEKTPEEIEEKIFYGNIVPSESDQHLLQKFHILEGPGVWEKRFSLAQEFEDDRFRELAEAIIFEEAPLAMPEASRNFHRKKIKARLFAPKDSPWNTLEKTQEEIQKIRKKKMGVEVESILESLERFTSQLREKYGN